MSTIVLRQVKGTPLTVAEVDSNFSNLNTDKLEKSGGAITTNASTTALTITQLGTGNALVVEDSANPDSTPFVVDASGGVIVGYTTLVPTVSYSGSGNTPTMEKHGTGLGAAGIGSFIWSNTTTGTQIVLNKSRGAAIGTFSPVLSGDAIGAITFAGDNGAAFNAAAAILCEVDGTPGTNDMPGRLVFSTTADGGGSKCLVDGGSSRRSK